jgi:hypothetical protein
LAKKKPYTQQQHTIDKEDPVPMVSFRPHIHNGLSAQELAEVIRLVVESLQVVIHVPADRARHIEALRSNPNFSEV